MAGLEADQRLAERVPRVLCFGRNGYRSIKTTLPTVLAASGGQRRWLAAGADQLWWRLSLRSFGSGSNFKVTQVQQISSFRQKFGYFGMMAAILIVTAALCWGLAHI